MDKAEVLLLWIVVFGYVASFCLNLFAFLSRKTKVAAYAMNVMWLALAAHTACGVVRWIGSGLDMRLSLQAVDTSPREEQRGLFFAWFGKRFPSWYLPRSPAW